MTARLEIVMPKLSDTMEEGTILKWLVGDGGPVESGAAIAEVETDKATMEIEADAGGVLSHRIFEGDTVPVLALIAVIAPEHEPATEAGAGPPAVPNVDAEPELPPAPSAPSASPAATGAPRITASPVARRLARDHDLRLEEIIGTGPRGRIGKGDVEAAIAAGIASAPPTPAGAPADRPAPPSARGTTAHVAPSRLQLVIARRMAQSKATQPDFTISTEVDMDAAVAMRTGIRAQADGLGATMFSYNDMVVRASALALREHPRANGSYTADTFELHSRVNVGVAVAAADALIVPTVFDADQRSLSSIAGEVRALAGKVRDGTIGPAELDGGTFTVSNLGMYGVSHFTAVINPPQAAILAVGALVEQPVVRAGELAVGHRMSLTLTCDHRILYGADAATFLARIRALLESPWGLMLT